MKEEIQKQLEKIVKKVTDKEVNIELSIPKDINHGDFTTNVAFQLGKLSGKNPLEMAQEIAKECNSVISSEAEKSQAKGGANGIDKVEAIAPGFINFYLSSESLSKNLDRVLKSPEKIVLIGKLKNEKIIVEFAHPNTH